MMALLTPRFWLGLIIVSALSFTHYFSYKSGRATMRAEWDKERAVQMSDALKASEANNTKLIALNLANQKVTNDFIAHKKISAATAAVSADKLRVLQAALDLAARSSAATAGSTDAAAYAIASECSRSVAALGGYADDLAAQVIGLQSYVRMVVAP